MHQVLNETDGKLVYCYDVYVNGIFGRNRKSKHESFSVAKHLDVALTDSQALALMDDKLKALKFKGKYTYKLVERQGRLKNEAGYQVYTTALFSDSREIARGGADTVAIQVTEGTK